MKNNKIYIIEFNGLPGAGKSSVAKELQKKFKSEDLHVIWTKDYTKKVINSKIIYFIKRCLNCGISLSFSLIYLLFRLKPFQLSRIVYLSNIYTYLSFYLSPPVNKEKPTILIADGGIVQNLLSSIHLSLIPSIRLNEKIFNKILNKLFKHQFIYIIVNCHITHDMAYKRIIKREKSHSRLNRLKGEELLHTLEIQENTFTQIRKAITKDKRSKQINIDMTVSISGNTQYLHDYIINITSK